MKIGLIWAQTPAGVIGSDGTMPWHLSEDLAHFKETTMGHPVLMGRRTWASFPPRFRPLPGRTNIVLTRSPGWGAGPEAADAVVVGSLDAGLEAARSSPGGRQLWVVGGGQIYRALLDVADTVSMTIIESDAAGDTLAPRLSSGWHRAGVDPPAGRYTGRNGLRYRFETWRQPLPGGTPGHASIG